MKNLSFRSKILLSTLAPIVFLSGVLMWIFISGSQNVADEAESMFSINLIQASKDNVKSQVEMAMSAIKPIYENPALTEEEAKKMALDVLRGMEFADQNYVFVYQYNGINLATRPKPELEGKNLIDLKDSNNKLIIKDLIEIAKSGGDFYQYIWPNPATNENEPKLSFAMGLDKWGWMIGSGVYLNTINEQIANLHDQIYAAVSTAASIEIAVIFLVIGLSIFWAIVLSKSISGSFQKLIIAMEKAAAGDLNARMEATSKDEIGQLTLGFNRFLDRLQEIIQGITKIATQVAESSSDLNSISNKTYEAISQQDAETIAIASAVEEMSATALEIARNGDTVKDAANDAGKQTQDGSLAIRENIDSVNELAGEISQAANAVSAVEKRTDEIQAMLEVIHSVTEQTNLLALNAAIEAARAGEQGRGFAVVADEVRSLAMRSAESADEIRKIIEGLITDTQSAVSTMNLSKERSEESINRTTSMADSLTSIDQAIQFILEKSAYIAQATEEQNQTAHSIAENTTRIKSISTTSSENMKTTRQSSEKLDGLSQQLLDSVNYFKV